MTEDNKAYVVNDRDNVATLLQNSPKGCVKLMGESKLTELTALDDIPRGHKIAICDIKKGEPIVKYGATVGSASRDIKKGEHVHLHNVASNFDERAASLDTDTAEPNDIEYKLV